MVRKGEKLAKLTPPRLFDALPRKRLFRQLDRLRQRPIIWVGAPPGAGKTTLIASYLEARGTPLVWFHIDPGDRDSATLFLYFIKLVAQFERARTVRLPLLTPEYLSDIPGFARRFFRTFFSCFPAAGTLVLDNCQEVYDRSFHEILVEATQEVPQGLGIIAISRTQPPAEFARLKANDQLAELGWEDLRLNEEEAAQILQRRGIKEQRRIAQIHATADGWAGGLALMSAHPEWQSNSWSVTSTGKEAVFEYFAGQIFEREPPALRQVLLRTALMPHLTPDTAISLSGDDGAANYLEQLYRRQYFIDRRTAPQLSYRYHDLFREFLISRAETEYDDAALRALRLQVARLLLVSDDVDRAMRLLCECGHFEEMQAVLLERAPGLIGQGRWKTLLDWIKLFPEAQLHSSGPLRYWRGTAQLAADPVAAREDFQAAFQLFERAQDAINQLTSIAGIIASHFIQDSSMSAYGDLIEAMAPLFARIEIWPDRSTELEVRSMFLFAASHVRPDHPLIGSMAVDVLHLLRDTDIDPNTRLAAGVRALVYFTWVGETGPARQVKEHLDTLLVGAHALPVHIAMGYAFRILYEHVHLADDAAACRSADRALEIARENGLAHSESLASQFQAHVNVAFARNLELAEAALGRVAEIGVEANLNRKANYHILLAYVHKWRGERTRALHHARLSVEAARANGPGFLVVLGGALPNIYVDAGELEEAECLLREVQNVARSGCFENFGATLLLEEAYIAFHRNDRELCHKVLRQALDLARADVRHAAVFHFMGGSIPVLFSEALDRDIHPDMVRELIIRRKVPPPANASARWPWPLSLRTLGQFEIRLWGQPAEFGRKAPRKALALLKALIACGGTEVPEQLLIDALWPAEEGDAAHSAYAMTLSRLRKLFGDPEILQQRAGKLSLHSSKCWVDSHAFETAVSEVASITSTTPRPLHGATTALTLYAGSFLPEDVDAPWAASMRERLRSHFIRAVVQGGRELESNGEHEEAANLYQRGLNTEDMAEPFYQGLMRCCAATGRKAEGVAHYVKLKQLLSITLGLKPSAVSENLYRSLRQQDQPGDALTAPTTSQENGIPVTRSQT